jgi:membrane protease YdiL (CAAX protease family)
MRFACEPEAVNPARAAGSKNSRSGLAAALWALLVVAPSAGLADPSWWLGIAIGTGILTGLALRSRRWPLAHAGLVATLVMVIGGWGVAGPWPLPLVVALTLYAGVVRIVPALRSSLDWVRWQRRPADRGTGILFVVTVVVSMIALLLYAWLARPDVTDTAGNLVGLPAWTIPLLGLAFVVINPAVEEALYRGVLYRALESETGSIRLTIAAQAIAFGALHVAGFPGGVIGMALAGVWGAILGLLRARTGGLRWSWWAHVATNIAIFGAVLVLGTDQGVL